MKLLAKRFGCLAEAPETPPPAEGPTGPPVRDAGEGGDPERTASGVHGRTGSSDREPGANGPRHGEAPTIRGVNRENVVRRAATPIVASGAEITGAAFTTTPTTPT